MDVTLEELQAGLRMAAAEIQALLSSEPDVSALTPDGTWTARETAVHVIFGAGSAPGRMTLWVRHGNP